ncbi:MAG: hypothetical protein SGILL_000529 [Bacillariaceae sp.]
MNALSMCLFYRSFLPKFQTSRREELLKFASDTRISSSQPQRQQEAAGSRWFSQKRIVENTLQELDGSTGSDTLFHVLGYFWQSTRIDDNLFLVLTSCMQKWCTTDPINPITKALTKWAVEMCDALQNPNALALLATIVLSSRVEIPNDKDFSRWFEPLANILLLQDQIPANSGKPTRQFQSFSATTPRSSDDRILEATLQNLRNGREQSLLSNLLDLTKSSRLVVLIHYILMQPQNEKLRVAVALIARGDSLDPNNIAATPGTTAAMEWEDLEEDHDEVDGDTTGTDSQENDNSLSSKPSSSKKARGTMQYKRQELLTIVKLDKLYHDRVQQASKKYSFDSATRSVAAKIVKAPWAEWGMETLSIDNRERKRYLETVGVLLQASSTLRPRSKLTPLSPLAFNQTVLQGIWNFAKEEKTDLCLSVLADLFSHYLVALSDQDFLRHHCITDRYGRPGIASILAADLVGCYGGTLHEIYWTKPVVSYEIEMENLRGRLMLSGTKLWNSLYERWNRLVRNAFCDESAWWFPHLSSREAGAVVPARDLDSTMGDSSDVEDSDEDDDDEMDTDERVSRNEISAVEAETDALADSFRDPKMARVLTGIPQALPFDRRVKLFHSLLRADKRKSMQAAASRRAMMAMGGDADEDGMMWFDGSAREQIRVRRDRLYQDSMEQLNNMGSRLKHQVQVTFVNAHGTQEAGIDGGGVFKEFVDDLIKDGFSARAEDDSESGAPQLFTVTPEGLLSVNLDLSQEGSMLSHYSFLGRVLSKAVYEGILVEPQFCLPFLNQLLGKANSLEDLKNFDEEYYLNLNKLRSFNDAEINSLGLTFELTVGGTSPGSTPRTVELVRSGKSMPVTKQNVFQYTHAVANQLLNVEGARQTRAFLDGFRGIIPVSWVRLFSAKELQKLISGDDSIRGIDVASLKRNMHYLGGYHESQPYIQAFWEILETELSTDQQRKFLRFMTSCSRQPLLGFGSLEPVPSIQQIRLRPDELTKNSRLPTSQTCMNLLKLPNYQDKQLLKEKLVAAVEAGAGFELT